MSESLMDAKIAAAEARTDAKFAELKGDVRAFSQKLDDVLADVRQSKMEIASARDSIASEGRVTRFTYVFTTVGLCLALIGTVVGILSYGGDRFAQGNENAAAISAQIQSTLAPVIEALQKQPPAR